MLNAYKETLTHYGRIMEYNSIYLNLGCLQTAKTQLLALEKLGMSINQLCLALDELHLSCEEIDKSMRHDIRNKVSIISTRAQLLQIKNAEDLGGSGSLYLQNILTVCQLIIQTLEVAKAPTAEIS